MDDTDGIAIVRLGPDDASDGLVLSSEAHWNQNEADWRFFLNQGIVFGVRAKGGQLVATAALLPYSAGNAWISMVLVTESWRRRGLATKLVDTCLNAATRQGLTCWLDATPAGAGVYGPLGFTPTLQLRRLRLENSASPGTGAPALLAAGDLAQLNAAGSQLPWDSIAARCWRSLPDVPVPGCCRTATRWRWSATAAPPGISARCSPILPIARLRWSMRLFDPRPGPC